MFLLKPVIDLELVVEVVDVQVETLTFLYRMLYLVALIIALQPRVAFVPPTLTETVNVFGGSHAEGVEHASELPSDHNTALELTKFACILVA